MESLKSFWRDLRPARNGTVPETIACPRFTLETRDHGRPIADPWSAEDRKTRRRHVGRSAENGRPVKRHRADDDGTARRRLRHGIDYGTGTEFCGTGPVITLIFVINFLFYFCGYVITLVLKYCNVIIILLLLKNSDSGSVPCEPTPGA